MLPAINNIAPGMGLETIDFTKMAVPHQELTGPHGGAADQETFAAMMRTPEVQTVASLMPAAQVPPPSLLEQMARIQNGEMRDVYQSSKDLLHLAPNMSMAEMTAYSNEVNMHMTIATMQFSLAATFGKSAGKGVDTLMRNQ